MRRGIRALLVALAATFFFASGILTATPASAHPLGNFTVNQSSALTFRSDGVSIAVVVDFAEIPAFQERQKIDSNGDSTVDQDERTRYRTAACARIATQLQLRAGGPPVPIRNESADLTFPAGSAGLTTLRLECSLQAALAASTTPQEVEFRNDNFSSRIGWREIAASGDGVRLLASDVPVTSLSAFLTRYPTDLLQSPPDQRSAHLRLLSGGPRSATTLGRGGTGGLLPRGIDSFTQSFTALVSRKHVTLPFVVLAVVLAIALGAIHALAPGHGKTIVAAYLVGRRGSFRHSALIGAAVTATHTAGVLALGIALSVSQAIAPERLYPILGLASGMLLASIGVGLLRRAIGARRSVTLLETSAHPLEGHDTTATGGAAHDHGGHAHRHPSIPDDGPLRWRSLAAMGFAGGLVPSPSALVVLLGAIALGRVWFGVFLVLAYGIGMAAALMSIGLLLVRARAVLDRRAIRRQDGVLARVSRFLPVGTASVIVGVGAMLAVRGVAAMR